MKVDLKEWQKANKKREKSRRHKRKRRFKNRLLISLVKKSSWCEKCGVAEDLTFHHRNPKKKKGCVCDIATRYSLDRTINEINKCDIVCRKCHDKMEGIER